MKVSIPALVLAAATFVSGCESAVTPVEDSRTGETVIACRASPIQFAIQTRPPQNGDCTHLSFAGDNPGAAGYGSYRYEQFFRFARDARGYLNTLYTRAERNTYLVPSDAKAAVNHSWPDLKSVSSDWQDPRTVKTGGRSFETVEFRLHDREPCTAFAAQWQPYEQGYARRLSGFFCGGPRRHSWDEQLAVLSAIRIED